MDKREQRWELDSWMIQVHYRVCRYAILLCISFPVRTRALSWECVLRIPSVSLKATKLGGFSEYGWPRDGVWTGTLKNPTKCLWRWEPDRRYNFFSPPAHLSADQTIAVSVCFGMLINKMAVSDETSLICMGLLCYKVILENMCHCWRAERSRYGKGHLRPRL